MKFLNFFKYRNIHDAVIRHDKDFIQNYILSGLDINKKDRFGNTALYTACEVLNVEAAQSLLLAGADPHIQNKSDMTALCILAMQDGDDSLAILKSLIEHHTSLNQDVYPRALESAIAKRNYFFIEELLRHDILERSGASYLHIACMEDDPDIVLLLLKNSQYSQDTLDGGLFIAHQSETITHLLHHGANPLVCNDEGKTPFMFFMEKYRTDCVHVLIDFAPLDTLESYLLSMHHLRVRHTIRQDVSSLMEKKMTSIRLEANLSQNLKAGEKKIKI